MEPTSAPKPTRICRQILTNGHYCKCPALRSGVFCYYHNRDRQRRRIFEKSQEIQRGYDQKRESRTEDEFNDEVVFSLQLPSLDDKASIHVACTNLMRALYCDHISIAKARVMMRAIAEANLSLRRGNVLDDYKQPVLDCDPEPVAPLGDSDGCVLPEERGRKEAIVMGRREAAARADAEIAAARARGENPPPRPLTPEEEKEAALEARRAESDLECLELWQGALEDAEPGSIQYTHAEAEVARTKARIAARKKTEAAQAGEPVPQQVSVAQPGSPAAPAAGVGSFRSANKTGLETGASAPGGRAGLQASVKTPIETEASARGVETPDSSSPLNQSRGSLGMTKGEGAHDARLKPCSPTGKAAPPSRNEERETRNGRTKEVKAG